MDRVVLRELGEQDERALRIAIDEFAAVDPGWDFVFRFGPDMAFSEFVEQLRREQHTAPPGWVTQTFLVATVGDVIVGRMSLRHTLNERLLDYGGHVGFGVVPPYRSRGYGADILRQTLPIAARRGITRLLLTCDDRNAASIRIIEAHGGVLEDLLPRDGGGRTRRYWIELS